MNDDSSKSNSRVDLGCPLVRAMVGMCGQQFLGVLADKAFMMGCYNHYNPMHTTCILRMNCVEQCPQES